MECLPLVVVGFQRQRYARAAGYRLCNIRAMKPEDVSNLIAATSAGVSLLSAGTAMLAIRSSRTTAREQAALAEEQTALQAKLTAIEEERRVEEVEARQHARVTASIPETRVGHSHLVLTNEGPAVARSVTVEGAVAFCQLGNAEAATCGACQPF
jgi:hypothetical protein